MPIVAPPDIDTLPPAPVRGQTGFSDATGLFLEALPDFGDQMQAAGEATYSNALEVADTAASLAASLDLATDPLRFLGISTSILTIDAGSKAVHLSGVDLAEPPAFAVDDLVALVFRADPTVRLFGSITAWDGADDMTVSVDAAGVQGSGGPYANWLVFSAAFFSTGATGAEFLDETADNVVVTPKSYWDAKAGVAVTYGSTITLNFAAGESFSLTVTGSPTFANPTGKKVGQEFVVEWTNGSGAGQPAFGSDWITPNSVPTFDTTSGHKNVIAGRVLPSGKIFWKLGRNPV